MKRFDITVHGDAYFERDYNDLGDYILHSDHAAAIAQKDAVIRELAGMADLLNVGIRLYEGKKCINFSSYTFVKPEDFIAEATRRARQGKG